MEVKQAVSAKINMEFSKLNSLIEEAEKMVNFYINHLDSPVGLEEYSAWSDVLHSLLQEKAELLVKGVKGLGL